MSDHGDHEELMRKFLRTEIEGIVIQVPRDGSDKDPMMRPIPNAPLTVVDDAPSDLEEGDKIRVRISNIARSTMFGEFLEITEKGAGEVSESSDPESWDFDPQGKKKHEMLEYLLEQIPDLQRHHLNSTERNGSKRLSSLQKAGLAEIVLEIQRLKAS